MKKCYILALSLILLFSCVNIRSFDGDQKVISILREVQGSVELAGQKQELIVPLDPLDFDSTLNWDLTINKKSLTSEKVPAYCLIEALGASTTKPERKTVSGSGKIPIPKGTQLKITLQAGEYSRLLAKIGAEMKMKVSYTEALVKYAQGDQPFLFYLEISGPAGLNNWIWHWTQTQNDSGDKVSHQFETDGKTPVIVEGRGKTPSGLTSQRFYFDLDVPPLIVLNPKVEPLQGPVELSVKTQANSVVNYGQKVSYTWNFGNGVELSGVESGNIYLRPGKYNLNLTAKINDYSIGRNWLIEVTPLTVRPNPVVTPLSGPVPLEITGAINPEITGGPTQLQYSWEIAGESVGETGFKKVFTEPGDYQIILKTEDKLHPNLVIPQEVMVVKALPPQLSLKPTVSVSKGIIPLTANFNSGIEIKGSPSELEYFWDFGDGETSRQEKPAHIFKKPGQFHVQLIITDRLHPGNLAGASLKMEVAPPEMKVKASSNKKNGLVPFTVNFQAQTSIAGSPCEPQYNWDFGDSGTSMEQNPSYTFKQEGKFTVTLEVKDRLHPGNSVKTTLQVETKMPKLRLTASVTPTSGTAPLKVTGRAYGVKEGSAKSELKYIWDFGDGTTAVGGDQTHTYEKPGTYSVLIILEDEALGISERKTIKVTVK